MNKRIQTCIQAGFMTVFIKVKNRQVLDIEGEINGVPGEIRTRDLLLRRQTLYPAELRVPKTKSY